MAQEYNIEQLNHGRKVVDFMRWDTLAFIISGLLIIISIAIVGVRGFNWGSISPAVRSLRSIWRNRPISTPSAVRW